MKYIGYVLARPVHQTKIIRNNCHNLQTATFGIDCTQTIDTISAGKKKSIITFEVVADIKDGALF